MLLDHYRPSTEWTPGRCIPDPVVVGGIKIDGWKRIRLPFGAVQRPMFITCCIFCFRQGDDFSLGVTQFFQVCF